jgi:hypothetical protein
VGEKKAPWAIILRAALIPHCVTEYKSFILPSLMMRWGFNLCLPSLSVHWVSEYKPETEYKAPENVSYWMFALAPFPHIQSNPNVELTGRGEDQ